MEPFQVPFELIMERGATTKKFHDLQYKLLAIMN